MSEVRAHPIAALVSHHESPARLLWFSWRLLHSVSGLFREQPSGLLISAGSFLGGLSWSHRLNMRGAGYGVTHFDPSLLLPSAQDLRNFRMGWEIVS
jgi:hypothetical protein